MLYQNFIKLTILYILVQNVLSENGERLVSQRTGRVLKTVNLPNHWNKIPYKFQTYNEPLETENWKMPSLSNGFLGTIVKNSSIYVNGLYNGQGSESHRVRIPSMTAIDAVFSIDYFSEIRTYEFNCRAGVYTSETRSENAIMTQHTYVHRKLKNIIVHEIRVKLRNRFPISIDLFNVTKLSLDNSFKNDPVFNPNRYDFYIQHENPENMTYEARVIKEPTYFKEKRIQLNDGTFYISSTIPFPEIANKKRKQVHTYYTNVPNKIVVYPNTTSIQYFHFLQSVDSDGMQAKRSYDEAERMIKQDPKSLLVSHVQEWEKIWQENGMLGISNAAYSNQNSEAFKLAQQFYVSFYSLYSAIPQIEDNQFNGLSPSGLSYGGLRWKYFNQSSQASLLHSNSHKAEGYGGHVTYHQEFWVLPLMALFSPSMSNNLIGSRVRRNPYNDHLNIYDQARQNAKLQGLEGINYPNEQGEYGIEVSPFKDAKYKIHTTADISFGIRCYLRATHSKMFLKQSISNDIPIRGEEYINNFARFWNNKIQKNPNSNEYIIKDVSFGEKPQSREVNNEAFTNYMASVALSSHKYALHLIDKNPYDPQYLYLTNEYDEKRTYLRIPYDDLRQLILEYDNYNSGQQNDETFVPFLNFPAQKQMTYMQKKSVYDSYASESKNLMSYASFMVGYLELNEERKAREYMKRQANQFNEPFQVLSEHPSNMMIDNNYNFLPGHASFIQSFIAGYCGIRVRDFQLDFIYPSEYFDNYQNSAGLSPLFKEPVEGLQIWNITGLTYRGNKLDIDFNLRAKSITVKNRKTLKGSQDQLEVVTYEGSEVVVKPLQIGQSITLRFDTNAWRYSTKRRTLQRVHHHTGYSENINILASIYAVEDYNRITRPSSACNGLQINIYLILACLTFFFIKS